jgi:hypothetical protein
VHFESQTWEINPSTFDCCLATLALMAAALSAQYVFFTPSAASERLANSFSCSCKAVISLAILCCSDEFALDSGGIAVFSLGLFFGLRLAAKLTFYTGVLERRRAETLDVADVVVSYDGTGNSMDEFR